tara:strand:- start:2312 stop:2683 length:372 start_codon:yes stop_codon:yes gene_type:complete
MNENREYDPWPLEINVFENGKVLELSFDNNDKFLIPAELLRVESPSAEVQGHGPNEKKILPGKQAVVILAVEQVGNYAVKLRFDDGHDTGIYSWKYLYHLGSQKAEVWSKYLKELASKGLSRT